MRRDHEKILLIDDDTELRPLLATYLDRHGFDTLLLLDTRQLDAFLERYQPKLLVLDLMLPDEDGLAACRCLRARGETVPVIMLTARDEPGDRVIGLKMGVDDYLGKPFDPRELVASIEASGEFLLLNALVANANRPMKRERLLEVDPAHPRYLQAVWGIGYVVVPDATSCAGQCDSSQDLLPVGPCCW